MTDIQHTADINDSRRRSLVSEIEADPLISLLRTGSPNQIRAWIVTNVTDLPSARQCLIRLAVAIAYGWRT